MDASTLTRLVAATAVTAFITLPLQAQPRLFADPPALRDRALPEAAVPQAAAPQAAAPQAAPKAATPAPARAGSERAYDLSVRYVDGELYDPATGRRQTVSLRGYVDTDARPGAKPLFVAPLINASPGDTVRMTLRNDLPRDPRCFQANVPPGTSCFNSTNMHSHGLWVSPSGNSDNVLLSIEPGVSFQYEYNIPADHPAGTFWYHPHRHGSTAIQVGSGMAGALVIKGNRKPTPQANGDLDTLLVTPAGKPYTERTLVFLQIPYACLGPDNKVRTDASGNIDWTCEPGETGKVEDMAQFGVDSNGQGVWLTSGRWTSINGEVLPTFDQVKAGVPERWRLVDAGVRETIKVQFRRVVPAAGAAAQPGFGPLLGTLTRGAALPPLIDGTCNGEPVPYQLVAADGLTMDQTLTTTVATLQPGYRWDLLVVFPEAGDYCMVQPKVSASANAGQVVSPETLLGYVKVSGTTKVPNADVTKVLVDALVSSANTNMPAAVRAQVMADLRSVTNGRPTPKLTRFVPHRTVQESELVKDGQEMVFFLSAPPPIGATSKFEFSVGNSFKVADANGYLRPQGAREYDPKQIDRNLVLGQAQQWDLRSYSVSHPFHIHVNPFQVVSVIPVDANGKDGADLSAPGAVDPTDGDDEYAGMRGVWKDTVWVKTNLFPGDLTATPVNYYKVTVRTRYQRYIGEYVLHCHILDHEDSGMMQNVLISVPDGAGGASTGMAGMAHGHK